MCLFYVSAYSGGVARCLMSNLSMLILCFDVFSLIMKCKCSKQMVHCFPSVKFHLPCLGKAATIPANVCSVFVSETMIL